EQHSKVFSLELGDYSLCCFKSHNPSNSSSNTRREEKTVPNKLIVKHVPPLSKIETDIKTMAQGVAKTQRRQCHRKLLSVKGIQSVV
ncbi:hypothetical protein AVEN_62933-2-1, partial [Araneus ventricosus]